ncbi:MAG: L,D-transpeptidase [Anaerolineaceae bacterium]
MNPDLSRRDFIKHSLMGLSAAALLPRESVNSFAKKPRYMRVGEKEGVSIYRQPDEDSAIVYTRPYNDIITVYDEVVGPNGPAWNPVWFRCWGGYVFSGLLYEVKYELQEVASIIREGGQLGEITMPYTRSYFYSRYQGWIPEYLLYYRSSHWVVDLIEGPDKKPWYTLLDELISVKYSIPAEHMRLIPDTELKPIRPEVPREEKLIKVNLALQSLEAYEGDNLVFSTKISSGSPTPNGTYNIQTKMPSKHMGNGNMTDWDLAYEYVGVPWNCFFEMKAGMATHGAYWHTNFGTPMSAGCLNMAIDDAKWIYLWTSPIPDPTNWATHGYGTPIQISLR